MDVRGFDSNIMLILRGGIPRPVGSFPEKMSQAILVGIILVGRLSVLCYLLLGVILETAAFGGRILIYFHVVVVIVSIIIVIIPWLVLLLLLLLLSVVVLVLVVVVLVVVV